MLCCLYVEEALALLHRGRDLESTCFLMRQGLRIVRDSLPCAAWVETLFENNTKASAAPWRKPEISQVYQLCADQLRLSFTVRAGLKNVNAPSRFDA
jgi:hypothetical protein